MTALALLLACGGPTPAHPPAPSTAPEAPAPVAPAAPAPVPPSDPWIPAVAQGWTRTDTVEHDFDGDGTDDIAVVLTPDEGSAHPERLLVVALGRPDGFERVLQTPCIAMCPSCGGVFGDPYSGLEQIGERSLRVDNYGGSSWRWSTSYTLAWRDGAMAVVGYDSSSFHSSRPEEVDTVSVNLLNGRATSNDVAKRHDQGKIAADDCDAVGKLGTLELR